MADTAAVATIHEIYEHAPDKWWPQRYKDNVLSLFIFLGHRDFCLIASRRQCHMLAAALRDIAKSHPGQGRMLGMLALNIEQGGRQAVPCWPFERVETPASG